MSVGAQHDSERDLDQAIIGVSVPIPLFDRNQGNLEAALRQSDQARDELMATKLRIATQLDQALGRFATARSELTFLERDILPGAQGAYDAVLKGFELGKFSFLDVLDAQRTLFSARSQQLDALRKAHHAAAALGALLAALILSRDLPSPTHEGEGRGTAEHAHEGDPTAASGSDEGPHGGRLFKQDSYALELTIFERGVPPQFRIYAYHDDRLLDPRTSDVSLTLERLGRPPQVFSFTPQGEYLVGDAVVEEPHSFKATLTVQHEAQTYRFGFEQVEARVTIPDAQLEASGVTLRRAEPGRIRSLVPLIGEIRLNEDRTVHVVPVLGGIVQSVRVNVGDRVQAGQVLAVIASRDLAEQRAELLAVQKRLALARTVYARERALWEARIAAEQELPSGPRCAPGSRGCRAKRATEARRAWQPADRG